MHKSPVRLSHVSDQQTRRGGGQPSLISRGRPVGAVL